MLAICSKNRRPTIVRAEVLVPRSPPAASTVGVDDAFPCDSIMTDGAISIFLCRLCSFRSLLFLRGAAACGMAV